jgi:hypothetical protein
MHGSHAAPGEIQVVHGPFHRSRRLRHRHSGTFLRASVASSVDDRSWQLRPSAATCRVTTTTTTAIADLPVEEIYFGQYLETAIRPVLATEVVGIRGMLRRKQMYSQTSYPLDCPVAHVATLITEQISVRSAGFDCGVPEIMGQRGPRSSSILLHVTKAVNMGLGTDRMDSSPLLHLEPTDASASLSTEYVLRYAINLGGRLFASRQLHNNSRYPPDGDDLRPEYEQLSRHHINNQGTIVPCRAIHGLPGSWIPWLAGQFVPVDERTLPLPHQTEGYPRLNLPTYLGLPGCSPLFIAA